MRMRAGWAVVCAGVSGLALVVAGCGDDSTPATDAGPRTDAGMAPPDTGLGRCTIDSDCDDRLFCTGDEICLPDDPAADGRGCKPGTRPCGAVRVCDEERDRCRAMCGADNDLDHDGHDSDGCGGDDCNDDDPNVYTGHAELCDALNVDEDCDPATFGDRDLDLDGYVDDHCCNSTGSGSPMNCGTDCADWLRGMNPAATEVCDGVDNDCDGMPDEGVQVVVYTDADGDLHGDGMIMSMACAGAARLATAGDDCAGGDMDPTRHHAQPEVCDLADNNCDDMIDNSPVSVTWYRDSDGDGFGSAQSGTMVSCAPLAGFSLLANDCDDTNAHVSPVALELCNGRDDDCNGVADFVIRPGNLEDDDGDGLVDMRCPGGLGTDCDDRDPTSGAGSEEICDGIDNDCNGMIDDGTGPVAWFVDLDGDGFGDPDVAPVMSCEHVAGRVTLAGDPDDTRADAHPGVADGCDGHDTDGDGDVDEDAFRLAYYRDADGDGFGLESDLLLACSPTLAIGRVLLPGDCDDTARTRYPTAPEICNATDDDCDGMVDEGTTGTAYYPDADGDGHGDSVGAMTACPPPAGYVMSSDDCDDSSPTVYPGAPERCNGVDDDCNRTVDDGAAPTCTLAGAATACRVGVCVVSSCLMARGDCDLVPTNGCEADLRTRGNCGACGATCAPGDTCGEAGPSGTCDASAIADLASTSFGTFARRNSGGVAAWGLNDFRQLGDGTNTNRAHPVTTLPGFTDIVQIDGDRYHACALRATGQVVCWGRNAYGQLGDGTTADHASPVNVVGLGPVVRVEVGTDHTCALRATGEVLCWGYNSNGQLGNGDATGVAQYAPVRVVGLSDAVELSVGASHSCARRVGGEIVCWGLNSSGQLGDGTSAATFAPVAVVGLPPATAVVGLAHGSGASHTCVRVATGDVWCWGYGDYGELGSGGGTSLLPVRFDLPPTAVEVAVSQYVTCVRRTVGDVWCSGYSADAEYADPVTSTSAHLPLQLVYPGTGDDAFAIGVATGERHTCTLMRNGHVWCNGGNPYGQVGDDSTATPVWPPVRALGLP